MRPGCGCVPVLTAVLLLAGAIAGGSWAHGRIVAPPEHPVVQGSVEDGIRGQQKIFDIIRRSSGPRPGRGGRTHEVVLTEAELNGFLSRHLGALAGVPVRDLAVALADQGSVEIQGRLATDALVGETAGAVLRSYLPDGWLPGALWISMRGPVRLELETTRGQPRILRFAAEDARVGRQRVPVAVMLWAIGPGGRRLERWPVPDAVESVTLERGRAVLRIVS